MAWEKRDQAGAPHPIPLPVSESFSELRRGIDTSSCSVQEVCSNLNSEVTLSERNLASVEVSCQDKKRRK